MRRAAVRALIVVAAITGSVLVAYPDDGSQRDRALEAVIVADLHAIAPTVVAEFEAATAAFDASNYQHAAFDYEEVIEVAPEFTPALRRLGACYVELGKYEIGIALVERALAIERSAPNLVALASCLAFPGQDRVAGSTEALERAYAAAMEAVELDPSGADAAGLAAQIAINLERIPELEKAVAILEANHPDTMMTHYYMAVRAAIRKHWIEAEREIREAGRLGLPEAAVEEFLDTGVRSSAAMRRGMYRLGVGVAAGALGLLLLLLIIGKTLSAATLVPMCAQRESEPASGTDP